MNALQFRPRGLLAAVSLLGLLAATGCRHLSGQSAQGCGCGCHHGEAIYCQPDSCTAVAPYNQYAPQPLPPEMAPPPGNGAPPPAQSTEMPPLPLSPGT